MIGPWTEIKLTVTVLAPLHVGTGGASRINGVGKEETEVALVAHDLSGRPILPASSIKGALRAQAGGDADTLFGPATITAETVGKAGIVTIWNAMLQSVPPHLAGSHADKNLPNGSNVTHGKAGMFIEARTAIEPGLGVAFENRLFHQQMVAPGCTFRLRFGLLDKQENGIEALQKLLALICKDGVTLGGGSGYGQGRLEGDIRTIEVSHHKLDADGELATNDMSSAWRAAVEAVNIAIAGGAHTATLSLKCLGPYISLDSSLSGSGKQKDDVPALQPLKLPGENNKARLSGASLHGALRARAVWLARLENNAHRDNRDLVLKLDGGECSAEDERHLPRAVVDQIDLLSTTELLFGVNGWRGLLRVRSVDHVKQDGFATIHAVKLDRFGGGPVHGGLFSTRAAINPRFKVVLDVENRARSLNEAALSLYQELLSDLRLDGIRLGHGSNKGYGWFDVS